MHAGPPGYKLRLGNLVLGGLGSTQARADLLGPQRSAEVRGRFMVGPCPGGSFTTYLLPMPLANIRTRAHTQAHTTVHKAGPTAPPKGRGEGPQPTPKPGYASLQLCHMAEPSRGPGTGKACPAEFLRSLRPYIL